MKRKSKYNMILVSRIILIIFVTIFLCSNPFQQKVYALNGADVALYNDSIAPSDQSGVWQDGITAIKNMLTTQGFTYEEITYKDLNESTENFSNLYKVILIPGGYALWYNYWISKAGKARIRNFINGGGGYFGICAGAYFACDSIVWDGVTYDDNFDYNAYGELTGYDLDLFTGTGTGAINEIAVWPNYKMTTINFQTTNTVLKNYKQVPYTEDMFYYGGPYFTDTGSQAETLGTYDNNGQAAIIAFTYGSGKVVLSGPHPETGGPNWDLAEYILNWLAPPPSCPYLYSWDGEEYKKNGYIFSMTHCSESESYQERPVIHPVAEQGNTLTFKIKEIDDEISYINSVAMYYKYEDSASMWEELYLLSASYNEVEDVSNALMAKDDERVFTSSGDEILLTYLLPANGMDGIQFKSVSSGYYLWTKDIYCEALELGPDIKVQSGDVVTLKAKINNMSTEAMPENAIVKFAITDKDGSKRMVASVSMAGLAPASPQWYSTEWLPSDVQAGSYSYVVSMFIGEKDITMDRGIEAGKVVLKWTGNGKPETVAKSNNGKNNANNKNNPGKGKKAGKK